MHFRTTYHVLLIIKYLKVELFKSTLDYLSLLIMEANTMNPDQTAP